MSENHSWILTANILSLFRLHFQLWSLHTETTYWSPDCLIATKTVMQAWKKLCTSTKTGRSLWCCTKCVLKLLVLCCLKGLRLNAGVMQCFNYLSCAGLYFKLFSARLTERCLVYVSDALLVVHCFSSIFCLLKFLTFSNCAKDMLLFRWRSLSYLRLPAKEQTSVNMMWFSHLVEWER